MTLLHEPHRSAAPVAQPVAQSVAQSVAERPLPTSERRSESPSLLERVRPYASIARPDHWFKNVFMALGVLLAYFYHPELLTGGTLLQIVWAVAATCLIASS